VVVRVRTVVVRVRAVVAMAGATAEWDLGLAEAMAKVMEEALAKAARAMGWARVALVAMADRGRAFGGGHSCTNQCPSAHSQSVTRHA